MRVLKLPITLPKPAGEQLLEFSYEVPGDVTKVLSAHVKSNGESNIYVESHPFHVEDWTSTVHFLLVSTGTEFKAPQWVESLEFVATLQFWGGQAVYHLYHLN